MTTAAILAFCKIIYIHIWMSQSFRGLILARFWKTKGFLWLFDCQKFLSCDSQIKGKDFLELFPGLKSEDHLFFFAGNKPRLRRGREDPPRSSRGCLNISRGRFFIFPFVTNVFILKPQYIKKKSFRFHLCQIYHHLQASIFQKVDFFHFHVGSLCNSCDVSSYEFVAVWCGKCCIGNGEWFKSMRRTLLEKCAS